MLIFVRTASGYVEGSRCECDPFSVRRRTDSARRRVATRYEADTSARTIVC